MNKIGGICFVDISNICGKLVGCAYPAIETVPVSTKKLRILVLQLIVVVANTKWWTQLTPYRWGSFIWNNQMNDERILAESDLQGGDHVLCSLSLNDKLV